MDRGCGKAQPQHSALLGLPNLNEDPRHPYSSFCWQAELRLRHFAPWCPRCAQCLCGQKSVFHLCCQAGARLSGSKPVQPSPTQSNPVQPCVNAPISQDMTGIYRIYMLFLNKSSGQTQSNRCLCAVGAEKTNPTDPFKWPEADSHALVGSTPAPGVVFRALAENRARRGISSVRVRFARTTANHRVHAATPGHPGFRIPHLCSICAARPTFCSVASKSVQPSSTMGWWQPVATLHYPIRHSSPQSSSHLCKTRVIQK